MKRIALASAAILALTGIGFAQESGPFNQNQEANQWTVQRMDNNRNVLPDLGLGAAMNSSQGDDAVSDRSTVFEESGEVDTMRTGSISAPAVSGDAVDLAPRQGYIGR